MAIPVKVPAFEGPLDLLLHLIDKNKIDIYDIPIALITDQYMDYLKKMDEQDMNVTSEFLVMAATLIDIKCRMLLPKLSAEEETEEDPREELVRRLLEHKEYKAISEKLAAKAEKAGDIVVRPEILPEEVKKYRPKAEPEDLLGNVTLEMMRDVFEQVLRRQEERMDPIRSQFGRIEKEEVSVPDKIDYVETIVRRRKTCNFRQLLEKQHSKVQVIVTFLAILELMKMGKITIEQEETFGEITIEEKENGQSAAASTGDIRSDENNLLDRYD
ncbi:MAG: segregation/condensation protein A [Eubacterium sp.]|nr:segregation/condensation protein A [Eubacterium sp.]